MSLGKKLAAEALGTFLLCFIGAGAICLTALKGAGYDGLLGVAIAHGLVLSIAVSATMNVSGGHLNPAVSIAMFLTRRISPADTLAYVVAQLAGATVAGALVLAMFNGLSTSGGESVVRAAVLGTPAYDAAAMSTGKAVFIEACLTFVLLAAIFGTAVDPRAPKIGGFGIGLAVAADILVGSPLTGASMNPARTFGPGLVATLSGNMPQFWAQHAVYWIGPVVGGAVAAVLYDRLILEKRAT